MKTIPAHVGVSIEAIHKCQWSILPAGNELVCKLDEDWPGKIVIKAETSRNPKAVNAAAVNLAMTPDDAITLAMELLRLAAPVVLDRNLGQATANRDWAAALQFPALTEAEKTLVLRRLAIGVGASNMEMEECAIRAMRLMLNVGWPSWKLTQNEASTRHEAQPGALPQHLRTAQIPCFIVDGHESDDPESNMLGDGQFPPFMVFDVEKQEYIVTPVTSGLFRSREAAQRIADTLNSAKYGRLVERIAYPGAVLAAVDTALTPNRPVVVSPEGGWPLYLLVWSLAIEGSMDGSVTDHWEVGTLDEVQAKYNDLIKQDDLYSASICVPIESTDYDPYIVLTRDGPKTSVEKLVPQVVVAVGHAFDGINLFGPMGKDEAIAWAENGHENWQIVPLKVPGE